MLRRSLSIANSTRSPVIVIAAIRQSGSVAKQEVCVKQLFGLGGGWLLLRRTVEGAEAPDQVQAIDADYFAIREK